MLPALPRHPDQSQLESIQRARLVVRIDDIGRRRAPDVRVISELERRQKPYFLAVIPERLAPEMGEFLRSLRHAIIWQHGVSHENNSPAGFKNEFPDEWPLAKISERIAVGRALIEQHLAVIPLGYIPPWNRLGGKARQALEELGFRYVSASGKSAFGSTTLQAYHASVDAIKSYAPVVTRSRIELSGAIAEALAQAKLVIVTLHPALLKPAELESTLAAIGDFYDFELK